MKSENQVRNLTRMQRLRTCASWRPDVIGYRDPATAAKIALKGAGATHPDAQATRSPTSTD